MSVLNKVLHQLTSRSGELAGSTCLLILLAGGATQIAEAGFVNQYALSNFSLIQDNGNGSASTPDFGASVEFIGPNNGSDLPGSTDLVIAAALAGTVQFNYQYLSLDVPGVDVGGYLVGGVFSPLADTSGQSGTVQFPVIAGQIFGFRITTEDNIGEPGVLVLSNFSAPGEASAIVPEPSTFTLVLFALAGAVAAVSAWRRCRRLFTLLSLIAVGLAPSYGQQTSYISTNITGQLQFIRTVNAGQTALLTSFSAAPLGAASITKSAAFPEFRKVPAHQLRPPMAANAGLRGGSPLPSAQAIGTQSVSAAQSLPVAFGGGTFGQLGLTHRDQRLANSGNQFSIEPPSPSIATGNGYVLEGVNNAIQVYSVSGAPLLPRVLSTNELFGLPPAINRLNGINGPYPTDMRVFYDQTINRWLVLQRVQDNDAAGNLLNSSRIYLAVSQAGDPTGVYNIYVMETTNAAWFGCPCIADYPQIGADQYGFYISVNQFSTFFERFVNAAILAISKASLTAGAPAPTVSRFDIPFINGYEFAIQPATTPPGASYFLGSAGLEYFVSSRSNSSDSKLAVWAMYNTGSLGTPNPSPILIQNTFPTLSYTFPNVASQRPGPLPYGSTLTPPGNLAFIDGGDNRVLSASYSGGRLYVTLSTQASDDAGRSVVAAAFVIFSPTFRAGVLAAPVLRQGYLVTNNNHLLRPSIAVNPQGRGAIAFTLTGPDYYPSAAFLGIDTFSTGAVLQVPGLGAFPEDGFTGYPGAGTGVARWGDYSAATAAADGSVWMAMQYIPNAPRTDAANWGTYLVRYLP